ncbi:hypothetical protein CYMTET_19003 [Cymbomonas tetramitiformis]|uniref:Uncharacterized protein n=1 Tax=Cymbomonas tetramitiformis TaxID=36881 RepID=A0AAE0G6Z5_9CHLO|nr:hypothetical protein CYMTET_19003 [Cymbomonas tetramitiformis]
MLKGSAKAFAKTGEHNFDVSLFGDDLPPGEGNNHGCPIRYSLSDSCWLHVWAGAVFYGNPPFDLATCERLIRKANRDFMTSPSDTAFLFLIPHSHLRPLAAILAHWEILHVYPTGSEGIFNYRREHTYAGRPLRSAGSEGGGDRVFIAGTPFPIAVIYRDRHSAMRFTPERWLHAACAHAQGRRLAVLVDMGLDLGRPISRAQLLAHGACAESCAACACMKLRRPSPKKPPK